VRLQGLDKLKNSLHRVSNSRPSGLEHSALTTTLPRSPNCTYRMFQKELCNGIANVAVWGVTKTFTLKGVQTIHPSTPWNLAGNPTISGPCHDAGLTRDSQTADRPAPGVTTSTRTRSTDTATILVPPSACTLHKSRYTVRTVLRGTMLQVERSRVRDPMRWINLFNLPNHSGRTRPWGSLIP
jgi:hypothetical protein